jgi:predicted RecB family nuclease
VKPQREAKDGFLVGLAAPARRALEGAGLTTLARLAKMTEAQVRELHGMGPNAITKLRAALKKAGLSFRKP